MPWKIFVEKEEGKAECCGTFPYLGYKEYFDAVACVRENIRNKIGPDISLVFEQIDKYCNEYYPENTPEQFNHFKTILENFIFDTDFPENDENLMRNIDPITTAEDVFHFEDENIEMYCDQLGLFAWNKDDNPNIDFPTIEVDAIRMYNKFSAGPKEPYFWIDNNREGEGHYYIKISLKLKSGK